MIRRASAIAIRTANKLRLTLCWHIGFPTLCMTSDAWTAVCSSVDLSIFGFLFRVFPVCATMLFTPSWVEFALGWLTFEDGTKSPCGWQQFQAPSSSSSVKQYITLQQANAARSKHMNEKVHWASFKFFIHSLFRKSPHSPSPLPCCTIIPCNHSWASIFLFLWSSVCLPMMLWSPAVD